MWGKLYPLQKHVHLSREEDGCKKLYICVAWSISHKNVQKRKINVGQWLPLGNSWPKSPPWKTMIAVFTCHTVVWFSTEATLWNVSRITSWVKKEQTYRVTAARESLELISQRCVSSISQSNNRFCIKTLFCTKEWIKL